MRFSLSYVFCLDILVQPLFCKDKYCFVMCEVTHRFFLRILSIRAKLLYNSHALLKNPKKAGLRPKTTVCSIACLVAYPPVNVCFFFFFTSGQNLPMLRLLVLVLVVCFVVSSEANPSFSSVRSETPSEHMHRACTADDLLPDYNERDLSAMWSEDSMVSPPYDCTCNTLKARYDR